MKTFILLLLLIPSLWLNGQITFEKRYYENGILYTYSVLQEVDSGFIITGDGYIPGNPDYDGCLLKTDKLGDTIWLKRTGFIENDHSYSVIKTNDNGYIFTGDIHVGYANKNLNLVKTNNNGIIEWNNNYGGVNWETGYSLIQTNNNDFIIAGCSNSISGPGAQPFDFYVIKTNINGNLQWEKKIGGTENEYAFSVCKANNNSCIVAGSTSSYGAGATDIYLVKLDYYGNIVWEKTYGSENGECAKCIQASYDGNYIITATQQIIGGGNTNIILLKINENGDTLWTKTYGNNGSYTGTYGIPVNDGGYIITGNINDSISQGTDLLLLKTNNIGNILWIERFGKQGYEVGNCVQQTYDGGYIITGYGNNSTSYFTYLTKTDSLGCVRPVIDSITGHLNVSVNDTLTYYCFDVRGEDYLWTTAFGELTSGQGNDTVAISWDQLGTDTIKVYVSNACGIDSISLLINIDTCVSPLLSPIFGNTDVYLYDVEEYYVNLIEGKTPVTYLWNVICGSILSGQNTPFVVVEWDSEGIGSIEVIATNECGIDTQIIEDIAIFFQKVQELKQFNYSIFPNPTQGIINVRIPEEIKKYEIEIFDINGRSLIQSTITLNNNQIDLSALQKGIYFIMIKMKNKTKVEKIILN